MAANALIILASAILVKSTYSQCLGRGLAGPYGASWALDGLGPFDGPGLGGPWPAGCGGPLGPLAPPASITAGYGGGLTVTSASPIAPTGLTVTSENAIEGALAVVGQLPFLGTIATDGVFPTVGAGAVSYGCGDGAIGIVAEGPIGPGAAIGPVGPALGIGPAIGGLPYNGIAGPVGLGCGCGAIY